MRIIQSSIFRALLAIVFGYLLVMYRNELLHWTTIAFGCLFFLSGLISVIAYYVEKRRAMNIANRLQAMSEMRGDEMETPAEDDIKRSLLPTFPIVGIGSMILGVILAIMPTTFVHGMMYVVSGLLVLGALNMISNLIMAHKFASIGVGFWVMPILLLTLGVAMIVKPDLFAAMPFRILGWALIVYGVIECINAIKISQCHKQYERIQAAQQAASKAEIEDAVIVEDNSTSPTPTI
ncbi:MAG: DUF308 domain-containing protein [Prevotella sp.]|nr:DUF308 domain-containing protein [Prevotella sp.]